MTTDALARAEARIDKLTQALFHVAGELWVMRDRQAVLERLLTDNGSIAVDAVERHRTTGIPAEALAKERDAFVAAILDYLAPEG